MKSLLLTLMFCAVLHLAHSQEALNQTDANSLKQGKWVTRYPGGSLKYEGSFVNDKPVGEWKRYHENGKTKAILNYRLNSDRLFAALFDEEGKLYAKGVFEGTLRDSTWNFYRGELIVSVENFRSGKRDGTARGFDQNGRLIWEKSWKNDLLDGKSVSYHPSGAINSEIIYVAGKKEGPALFYDENGVISMEGRYKDDLSEGDWKVFDKDGKFKYLIKYGKGEILNKEALDSMQINEFKKYDKIRGRIAEPKMNESGMPEREQ
jgi:antitoxin component YwqK of YwqJK toxin-antitoxin module